MATDFKRVAMDEKTERDIKKDDRDYKQLKTDLLMSALAIISICIGLYDISNPEADFQMTMYDWIDLSIVIIFMLEFISSIKPMGGLKKTLKKRWWELPSMIPITGGMVASLEGISLLRGVRLFRLVRIIRILRIVNVTLRFKKNFKALNDVYERAYITAILCGASLIILLGAVSSFFIESARHERMATFQDCVWWSLNMFTNVAYVDFQPKAGLTMILAAVLQLLGMAFIGIFTASLTHAIIGEGKSSSDKKKAEAAVASTATTVNPELKN